MGDNGIQETNFFDCVWSADHHGESDTGKVRLNQKLFLAELSRNVYKFESKLNAGQEPSSGKYVELVKLVKFLAKYVNVECLRTAPKDRVIAAGAGMDAKYALSFDFDFIDEHAFQNYKLFNKLTLNPNVSLLIGGLSNEREVFQTELMNRFYVDQFNAPVVPKQEIIEYIKRSGILSTGDCLIGSLEKLSL